MILFMSYFGVKHENQTLAQFYAYFNKLSEKVKEETFPITAEVKEMHERWNKSMVLFLTNTTSKVFEGSTKYDWQLHCQIT